MKCERCEKDMAVGYGEDRELCVDCWSAYCDWQAEIANDRYIDDQIDKLQGDKK